MTTPSRSRSLEPPRTTVKLHDPGDVVALVPYVIGYFPVESIVVASLTGPRRRLGPTVRVDIADSAHIEELSAQVADVLVAHGLSRVFVLGYSTDQARAEPAVAAMRRAAESRSVEVEHALRADGRRWWCCHEQPRCGPPEGTMYDVQSMRVSAEAVAAGLSVGTDRDESRRLFARDPARVAAVEPAIRRLLRPASPSETAGAAASSPPALDPRQDIARLLGEGADRPAELEPGDIARLAVSVRAIACRDDAWAMMERPAARAHLDLWAQVTRAVPDELLSGPCSLAGFAAWLAGDGTIARHAVERVLAVSPTYSMANLLEQALDGFLDPRTWDATIRTGPV